MQFCLHVGHGKTGSSFLQSWLALNALNIQAESGLVFPLKCPFTKFYDSRAESGNFSMGNGYVLDPLLDKTCSLRRARGWYRRIKRMNHMYETPLQGLLFSCESWTRSFPLFIDHLIPLINSLGFETCKLFLIVRNPLDHAISVYGQMVKRHGFAGTVDDWFEIYDFPCVLLRFLQKRSELSNVLSLKVANYSKSSDYILMQLCDWLSLSSSFDYINLDNAIVNRSLTAIELDLMRYLNQLNPSIAKFIGEELSNAEFQKCYSAVTPSIASTEKFVSRWASTVMDINTFLPSESQLVLEDTLDRSCTDLEKAGHISENQILLSQDQINCLVNGTIQWAKDLSSLKSKN